MDDHPVVPRHYNDGNRAFLQAFLARGSLTFNDAKPIIAAIASAQEGSEVQPEEVSEEQFEDLMSKASSGLSNFDYEIRSTIHQGRKERVYAIVNTTSDPMTQLATLHSAEEIAFVKRVIDAMFEKYNSPRMEAMCLDEMQANKLRMPQRPAPDADNMDEGEEQPATQTVKGLKSSEAESVMRSMVEEGWFERSQEGLYSLSPRALMELRSWLVESYNEPDAEESEWQRVKFCGACKEIVTNGQRCAERDCNVRLHDHCTDAFWRSRRDKKCPKCGGQWSGGHFVGERSITETEAYRRGKRRSGHGGRSNNLVEQIMDEEEEEPAEEDEQT